MGIAFFYFRFNEDSKQDESAMIRALLLQLSAYVVLPGYSSNGSIDCVPSPHDPEIQSYIYPVRCVRRKSSVWSKGGCPECDKEYERVALDRTAPILTSRDLPDIRESLSPMYDQDMAMKNADIDKDITTFISYQLNDDLKLRRWQAYHDHIQKTLTERAQGI